MVKIMEFVSVNGEVVKANYKAKDGDHVTIQIEEEEELNGSCRKYSIRNCL